MNNPEVLIIDDESQIRRLLEITMESNDYAVVSAPSAKEGLRIAASHPPDLVILDLGLPDENGHRVLEKLREWYTRPIIILSVQSNEEDIVRALDNGANDYLIKPFRTGELLARIRSVLRNPTSSNGHAVIDCNELQIDLAGRTVKKNDELVKLTSTEYSLLALLAQHEGKVLTHQYLLREVWGPGFINQSQYLRVFIAQLRKKIEIDPNRPAHILTESGVGYRFVARE
ncbi:MAG: response regulator [Bacteroidetes bacterium]|jgi:two-component system KDP operon response regulator KdpE|nr:MAG: response regulator [Bacteroidota bacterium]